jgi:serine/threonine protein kinase/formylglycine-generating enzyme required for sulfatase activity
MSATRERWRQVRELLEAALVEPLERREALVRERAGADASLAAEVLRLLARDGELGAYLEPPDNFVEAARELRPQDIALLGSRIGVWRLERKLGSGGMGTVYLARRAEGDFDQRGAVKLLRAGLDSPQVLQRFRRERRLLAQIEHPNVARLLDGGVTENGAPYIVMEYVEGAPIDAHCNANKLSIGDRLRLFVKVCGAVQHAHQHLVVHRDLKPGNIFVNASGDPKLLDFGLAKVLSDDDDLLVTQTGAHALTPAYASPEQVRGENVTTASDVYSLGVVLYELLTGQLPYKVDTTSISELARRICELAPPPPSEAVGAGDPARAGARAPELARRRLRGDLDTIVLKALHKDPKRRYASAGHLAEDIGRHLAGWPVLAQSDSLLYRSRKFVGRHRALAIASALGLTALVAGLVVSSRLWLVAHERAEEVTRLSDVRVVQALAEDADRIWPAVPPAAPKMRMWIRLAEALLARRPLHAARLAELRSRGREADGKWSFDTTEEAWEHEVLSGLLDALEQLGGDAPVVGSLREMHKRADFAESVAQLTLEQPAAAKAWLEARDEIARDPRYGGLELPAQLGLLPLGRNEVTGLWEFWHPQTGERPQPDERGGFAVDAESSLVFVLLPGGEFEMGSPRDEAGHSPEEGPLHTVALDPFFASKFELTQGQFARIMGRNPSILSAESGEPRHSPATPAHPLEGVDWTAGRQWLDRAGLDYPTEAQWEYAARAGTHSAWWSGSERDSLRGAANLADGAAAAHGQDWLEISDWPELDDGFAFHAPVGSYRANAFGLYDVLGNVCEWCEDAFGDYSTPAGPGDGRRTSGYVLNRPMRGGGFSNKAAELRCAKRVMMSPEISAPQIGIRPVRRIVR